MLALFTLDGSIAVALTFNHLPTAFQLHKHVRDAALLQLVLRLDGLFVKTGSYGSVTVDLDLQFWESQRRDAPCTRTDSRRFCLSSVVAIGVAKM